jgi:GT2 family glycosyltransferase
MKKNAYSLVIATLDRPDRLRDTLQSLAIQSIHPESVIVIDASSESASELVCQQPYPFELRYQKAVHRSAACQRNQGLGEVVTEYVGFLDDDVVLEPDVMAKLYDSFRRPETGGIAARMRGFGHHQPSRWLRAYYELQAGYQHLTYGGKLFGSAINCLPCYEVDPAENELIPGEWLPAGVVLFRTEALPVGGFPEFAGYSFMEDVFLSAQVAQKYRLYFHTSAWYQHFPSISAVKRDRVAMARMRIQHRRKVALEVMRLDRLQCETKLILLRLFDTIHLVQTRPEGWRSEIFGTWTA